MIEAEVRPIETSHTIESSLPEESLFDHYPIDNEVKFVKKIRHLSEDEQRFYIRQNVIGFLGEYAGKIPYKKISFILKEDGLDFAGINMNAMYQRLLDDVEVGGREWCETQGMLKVQEGLATPSVNVATVLSPPKDADYSFAFHFVRGPYDVNLAGTPITEYILRYPERQHSILNSKQIAQGLTGENVDGFLENTDDFLMTPFLSYQVDPKRGLKNVLRLAGIDEKQIEKSKQFEQLVEKQLLPWVDQYHDYIIKLSRATSQEYPLLKKKAETLLGALYNDARFLQETIDTYESVHGEQDWPLEFQFLPQRDYVSWEEVEQMAASRTLTVQGGNCPPAKRKDELVQDYLSVSDIYNALLQGNTLESLLDSEPFECPKCQKKTHGPVGNQCPKCGLTKEDAEKEGFITC
jgi:hypothetical protein